ncbi:MAG: arylamine N-acetyltransferase, partial [Oscillospiraceae bacterium]|nr:arylamine N-acetyltransferase [Oscillospiraceae bacterium]
MHEPLYAPVPDVGEALERLGLGRRAPSLEFLDEVLEAYISTIPFENYDVWHEGRCPSLAVADLHRKLITLRRGGYCFELNGYLCALLNALGFQACSVAAFVLEGETELNEPGHRSVLCRVEGGDYFCDGGYGGSIPRRAVPLEGQARGGFYLRRRGLEYRLYRQ